MADHWLILKNEEKVAKFCFTFVQNALASLFLWFDLCSALFLESPLKAFRMIWLVTGLSLKTKKETNANFRFIFAENALVRLFLWFDSFSAPFLESSREAPSVDMANHCFIIGV